MASRQIDMIVIHCSASPNGRPQTVQDIDAWHRARGFKRTAPVLNPDLTSIGYHFVIYIDGSVHTGRDISEVGAHAEGHNAHSIGICLIGTDQFTMAQWTELSWLVSNLMQQYAGVTILGHRDLPNVHKLCPGFDVATWLNSNRAGLEGHVLAG
jgi:N-acetyl-anhydromuramyl-L-alanine amidase AmpD